MAAMTAGVLDGSSGRGAKAMGLIERIPRCARLGGPIRPRSGTGSANVHAAPHGIPGQVARRRHADVITLGAAAFQEVGKTTPAGLPKTYILGIFPAAHDTRPSARVREDLCRNFAV